jgi:hypothetical protein
VIRTQNPGGATQTLEARSGRLSRAGRLRDASRCSQTGRRQQPTLVTQLGEGAQHGAAERSLQTGWESPNLPADLKPSNRPVRTRMRGGVAGDVEDKSPRPYADVSL